MNTLPQITPGIFGMEVVLDLYGCDPATIRSKERLEAYAKELCEVIEMKPFGDIFAERFGLNDTKTAGYSIVQLIETSSITGHFSEEKNAAYINIFSCKQFDPHVASDFTQKFFGAETVQQKIYIRE